MHFRAAEAEATTVCRRSSPTRWQSHNLRPPKSGIGVRRRLTGAKREDRAEKDAGYDMQGEGGDEEIVARNIESPATFKNSCVNPE